MLRQSGCRMLVAATAFKTSDYVAMVDEVRGDLDGARAGRVPRARLGGVHRRRRAASAPTSCARARPRRSSTTRSTSSTRAAPRASRRARRSATTTSSTTATSSARAAATREEDRVCIPVPYYHCFGMVMGNLACTSHGACMVIPAPRVRPGRDAAGRPGRAAARASTACRRCSSPSSSTRSSASSTSRSLRTGIMAGSPCPIETMRRVVSEMHMEEVTICYGMTETSPVSTQTGADDPLEKRVGTVGRVHPHVEVKVVDPESGAIVDRGEPGELCTRAYSVMLGYWDEPEKTADAIDRAPLDAHRRPRADGRRGLPEDRRADQGHGHPRRRERLPARDRGVPDGPPGRRRRPGRRRARPALRRGADGLDRHPRRRRARPRRGGRVLPRARSPTTRCRATFRW